ncbi:MurR/RpiR family transcriptional regulator [Enterococcus saccharolyticus]|uniref:RpiR family transcriptional regulator n=1 Tax=Candidatus Enterococcus willemsii TaxID=1857215 RepID=A0ABQ6Z106_9ENTE|nr:MULTISPECIES: MurR/RpiR family transcriptional regulator [Enterococcus]KAF1304522.1 RpiR family transcriptional regulator [Enterococcus sp. CU12B]MCD5001253.1 MurR/RpiR family transcriptional regulator [Enterococcus saccharolyticus]
MLFLNYTPELSQIDLEIYKYIATHIDQVIYMRIRELAEKTHTSTASILRFCKKFECEGFSEFKIKLQMYNETINQSQKVRAVDESAFINFIHRTSEERFQDTLHEAAKILAEKEMVLFIGAGSSNIIASYGAMYFSSIFQMAFHIEDPSNHPIEFFRSAIAEKACIIALSVGGESSDIINYLNHFIAHKSAIISITNSANSTIAKLSDINLAYYISTERKGTTDITSQVPALYTIEYLAKEVQKLKNTPSL